MTKKDEGEAALRRTGGDVAHAAARAALSTIPYVGGPLVEAFQMAIGEPISRRRDRFILELAEAVDELRAAPDAPTLEEICADEAFVSSVMQASQIALRTHQREKLEALRNAVLNVARGDGPEENLRQMFFALVDRLTANHLRLLKLMQQPKANEAVASRLASVMSGGLSMVIDAGLPELAGRRQVYDQLWSDLFVAGLLNTQSPHGMMTGHGLAEKRTSQLGDQLLDFIAEGNRN